ncbi:MAG TPA: hypothetical protein VNO21_25965 [Polyangiaceae bacterium]|nr:hypothetical protein [Polyangiaceae bacterium]
MGAPIAPVPRNATVIAVGPRFDTFDTSVGDDDDAGGNLDDRGGGREGGGGGLDDMLILFRDYSGLLPAR